MSVPSDRAPLIGLTGRRKSADQILGTADNLKHLEGDWYYADYARGVLAAGGLPVHLPLDVDPVRFVGRLDGVLLSGGADVAPARFGAEIQSDTVVIEEERDEFELSLLTSATEAELPILGICRGLQVLNVFAGGTLHQDVPSHARYDIGSSSTPHSVRITPGSQLEALYGTYREVNSLHHQTVDQLGAGFLVTAEHDGTVEGMEHVSLPILAVQWHPEMMTTRDSDPVFQWLVDRAGAA